MYTAMYTVYPAWSVDAYPPRRMLHPTPHPPRLYYPLISHPSENNSHVKHRPAAAIEMVSR